jgi:hypothetical protein
LDDISVEAAVVRTIVAIDKLVQADADAWRDVSEYQL